MTVGAFVRNIETVENIGSDTYRITCNVTLMDAGNSPFQITFDAQKGADWPIMCRQAVSAYALETLGETVDLVVMPGLDTI
jgi:hypothetical protein